MKKILTWMMAVFFSLGNYLLPLIYYIIFVR